MSDFYLPYGGDIGFSATGDYQLATSRDLSIQRVVRGMLTNNEVDDTEGNVISPPDDVFNPNYGQGMGRLIGQPATNQTQNLAESKARGALVVEPTVDQTIDPTVQFATDVNSGAMFMRLEYGTIEGEVAQTGVRLT